MTSMEILAKSSLSKGKRHSSVRMNQIDVKKNIWYRLIYSIGYIGFFSGCLYQSWSFLDIYFKYPTTMEVNVFQEPIVKFPAVTVCNGNRVRKSEWCKLYYRACEPVPADMNEAQKFITKLQDDYKYLNKTIRKLMGHQKENFIRSCQFEEINCMDLIGQYFNYEYTNCFTINSRWANNTAKPLTSKMFRPRMGRSSELSIMLNLEREEYSPMNPVVRARMTIHSPDTVPNPQYDGVTLQPGRTYNYGVRKSVVNVLPSPYQTDCKNYSGMLERRTGAKMTQEDCMSECCAHSHVDRCGCTVHRLSLIYDLRTCWDPVGVACLAKYDDEIQEQCYPKCGMPCSKITYSYVSVDSYALQQGACASEDLYNRTLSDSDRDNLVCLKVFFSSAESEIYSHKPKYNGIQVFSVVGGYIGLWLGVSFLDVHGYLISMLFNCTNKKNDKNNDATQIKVKRFKKKVLHSNDYPQG